MLDRDKFNNVITYVFIVGLFILAFLIIKPIIYSIIFGVLLAYIFYPVYNWLFKKTKNKIFSALIICLGLLILTFLFVAVILTAFLKQIIEFSVLLKGINFVELIRDSLPESLISPEISKTLADSMKISLSKLLEKLTSDTGKFLLSAPVMLLQLAVVFLTFFFSLKDGKEALDYFKSLAPFSKELQEKFFKHFRDITNSVLIGQIVVGVIQGLIAGIGYFIFRVPNALSLTILTVIIGVIPLIGPWLVWVPVDIYLFAIGRTGSAIGLLIYGVFLVSWIDNIIRPVIVSRKTKINSGIILIGMIGGLFVFGVLGLIIGPLVLAYVLLLIEIYRKHAFLEDLIFKEAEPGIKFPKPKVLENSG